MIEQMAAIEQDVDRIEVEGNHFSDMRQMRILARISLTNSVAATTMFLDNGVILAVMGMIQMDDHQYSAWSLISHHVAGNGYSLTRKVERAIEKAHVDYDINIMTLLVDKRKRMHCRWAKLLGFMPVQQPEDLNFYNSEFKLLAKVWS